MKNMKCIFGGLIATLLLTPTMFAGHALAPRYAHRTIKSQKPVAQRQIQLKGYLKAPSHLKKTPKFSIFYAGKCTVNDEEGLFSIPLDKKLEEYYLLICGRFHQNYKKTNTVNNLGVYHNKYHKFYHIYKQYNPETKKYVWKFAQKPFAEKNYQAPENCVVLVLNPAYVEKLEDWEVKFDDAKYVKLPKIVLRDNVVTDLSKEDIAKGRGTLERASRKSVLYPLDSQPFHETVRVVKDADRRVSY